MAKMTDNTPAVAVEPILTKLDKVDSKLEKLQTEIERLESINAELLAACKDAAKRMERCRSILHDYRGGGNWGMLDTENQRAAIANAQPQGQK